MDSKWQWEGDEVFSFQDSGSLECRENRPENSICHGKNHGFLKMFPLNQAIDRIVQMFRVVQYDMVTDFLSIGVTEHLKNLKRNHLNIY